MTFAAPLWLLALPALLLLALVLRGRAAAARAALPGVAGRLRGVDGPALGGAAEWTGGLLLAVGLALPRLATTTGAPPRPAIVVVDVSRSMLAEDEEGGRFARARALVTQLLADLAGRRVGLVTFAGAAHEIAPPTFDHAALVALLEEIDPRRELDPGSDALPALDRACARLTELGGGDVFLFSDGEFDRASGGELAAAALQDRRGIAIHCVALGRSAPVALVLHRPDGALEPLVDESGRAAVSVADRARLAALAAAAGGRLVEAPFGAKSFEFAAVARGTSAARGERLAPWSLCVAAALALLAAAHVTRERIA